MTQRILNTSGISRALGALVVALAACARPDIAPPPAPASLTGLIGEYGPAKDVSYFLERSGAPRLLLHGTDELILQPSARDEYRALSGNSHDVRVAVLRDAAGGVMALIVGADTLPRRQVGPADGGQLRVHPVGDPGEILRRARTTRPPAETGSFLPADLVEVVRLDSTIHLDIRYATKNNFLGLPFYSSAKAFLQRPAAEAVVRVHRALKPLGYGLLIHDAYRPWYVTRAFWDATPDSLHWLVANPASGSRHNRGSAVDLSIYRLDTGAPVQMVGTYDESTNRSKPDYPGGTSSQRWHRELLRKAMEAQGFTVNDSEWWHFDYRDWRKYAIGNAVFEELVSH